MTRSLTLEVRGLPVAQGSARAFIANGRAFVATEGNRTRSPLGAWRGAIAAEAREAMGDEPAMDGPVSVRIVFRMPRPKSHYLKAGLRPSAPSWHSSKPDIDKLTRAVLDAITVVAIRDDSQVVRLIVSKTYESPSPVGALVEISEAVS